MARKTGAARVRHELGGSAHSHLNPIAAGAPAAGQADVSFAADHDGNPRWCEGRVGERNLDQPGRHSVPAGALDRRHAGQLEVGLLLKVTRVWHVRLEERRLEQPRVLAAHDLRARHGGEIRRPLVLRASAKRLPEAIEDQDACKHRGKDAE
jgi:hypothetical protein